MLKTVVVLFALLTSLPTLASSWSVDPKFRDPKTQEVTTAATSTNAEGYKIAIFRSTDQAAYILFALPNTSFDKLPLKGRIAAYRPDQSPAVFIETNSMLPALDPYSLGDTVRARIWHGKEITPFSGSLRNVMSASKLTVRFFTDTGTTVDTAFDLAGASPVIAKAVGFPETVSPEITISVATSRKLKSEAAMKCYIPTATSEASDSCMKAIEACAPPDVTKLDAAAYTACLSKIKWPR